MKRKRTIRTLRVGRILPGALGLALGLLAACADNILPDNGIETATGSEPVPLHIASAGIEAATPAIRAVAVSPLTTGSIGVFRSKGPGYAAAQDNKKYTCHTASGDWRAATTNDTVFLMAPNAAVCAYYPYHAAYTDKTAVPLTPGRYTGTVDDLANHDPNDLCYATDFTVSGALPSADLVLKHAMTLVQLRFGRLNYANQHASLTSVSVENPALVSAATLNLTDGTCTTVTKGAVTWTPGAGATPTGIEVPETGDAVTSALLVPCTLDAAGTTFRFTLDGKKIEAHIGADRLPAFEAGKIYRFSFVIHAASVNPEEVSAADWANVSVPSVEVEAGPKDYVEAGNAKWALADLTYSTASHTYGFAPSTTSIVSLFYWNALGGDAANATAIWNAANDPCRKVEPKGTWSTPTVDEINALIASPHTGYVSYNGVSGIWFGSADATAAAAAPTKYLFLPAGIMYWSNVYGSTGPRGLQVSTTPSVGDSSISNSGRVRCVKR